MNKKQRRIIWLGIMAFVLFTLCPPWIEVVIYPSSAAREIPIGSYLIWDPPRWEKNESNWIGAKLDSERLALEWLVVIVLTVAATWSFRSKAEDTTLVNTPASPSPAESSEGQPHNTQGRSMQSQDIDAPQPQSSAASQVTKCPACYAENPGRLRYCPDCGALQKSR